jgi:hypothetical protein
MNKDLYINLIDFPRLSVSTVYVATAGLISGYIAYFRVIKLGPTSHPSH